MKMNAAATGVKKYTHEGARAFDHTSAEQDLRRSVMACMLWESSFYENGKSITERIAELVQFVPAENVAAIAVEARTKMKLRHVPLLLAVELSKHPTHRHVIGKLIPEIVQRADELAELLAIYSLERTGAKKLNKLSEQVKRGLAKAFTKFSEYDLAKYNRANAVKLRDVMFLVHPKPLNEEQAEMWKRLIDGKLATPDTWEVAISAAKLPGENRTAWERLLEEDKLGALALLRNLRNMNEAGVRLSLIRESIVKMKVERVLPFRFVAAARYAPQLEPQLEAAMYRALEGAEKLAGKTAIVIDHSGSMDAKLSAKSDMTRLDAACALAILLREVCEDIAVVVYSDAPGIVAPRRGFALRDLIVDCMGSGGTNTASAIAATKRVGYDRIIVITDEQSHQALPNNGPNIGDEKKRGYFVNVSVEKNGIGYGDWTHLDGFSEAIVSYIQAAEAVRE